MSTKRYFLEFSYNGSNYHGWQAQKNAHSVQAEIEKSLSILFQQELSIVGAGRTDAGVHAQQMFAHADLTSLPDNFEWRLNGLLPSDIALNNFFRVVDNAHARFDAVSRGYTYLINRKKNVFMKNRSYFLHRKLDINKMNEAAKALIGTKDFSSFSKSHTQTFTNICEVTEAEWIEKEGLLYFRISANRFLRNMVRAIVGTLLGIGDGSIHPKDMAHIIQAKNRSRAGFSVPAHGLYLSSIKYPSGVFI